MKYKSDFLRAEIIFKRKRMGQTKQIRMINILLSLYKTYLFPPAGQFRITAGSHAKSMEMKVRMNAAKHDARIIINVLGGLSFIFLVNQPPPNVPIHTETIPTIARI